MRPIKTYSVKQLSELAGVTGRTIRYYDEIHLLKPAKISENGYRVYSTKEVDLLQQILFLRNLNLPLEEISRIVHNKDFAPVNALEAHLETLKERQRELSQLIATVEKTIQYQKGERDMSDKEKFEGLKQDLIKQNEKQYGEELKQKYTKEAVEASNRKFSEMSKEEFEEMEAISKEILDELSRLMKTKEYQSEQGEKLARLHKKWLTFTWPDYSAEAHKGLAQMYVDDPRFTAYYDKEAGTGAAALLRDCIHYHM